MMDEQTKDFLKLGKDAYRKKEYSRAEDYLTRVVEQHDDFADVFNMLGVICHDRGLFTKAQQNFERALAINPRYTEAALNLAVTYNDLGQYDQAKGVFTKALSASKTEPGELDPFVRGKIANMYAGIGDVYQAAGLYERAADEYKKALALGPGFVDIRLKLAQSLRDDGKQTEALTEFRKIIEDQPSFVSARVHLGVTLYSMGKTQEAVLEWTEVLRLDPGNKSCQMYINLVKEEAGRKV
jgi:tetratricopeptide (TPR) repeat protein